MGAPLDILSRDPQVPSYATAEGEQSLEQKLQLKLRTSYRSSNHLRSAKKDKIEYDRERECGNKKHYTFRTPMLSRRKCPRS